jgi:TolA-binding protein
MDSENTIELMVERYKPGINIEAVETLAKFRARPFPFAMLNDQAQGVEISNAIEEVAVLEPVFVKQNQAKINELEAKIAQLESQVEIANQIVETVENGNYSTQGKLYGQVKELREKQKEFRE